MAAAVICTGADALYEIMPIALIEPGMVIVDKWIRSRGTATIGVAFTHTATHPVCRDGDNWVVRCRSDIYLKNSPQGRLPVLTERRR
jgi:hypothetical protein